MNIAEQQHAEQPDLPNEIPLSRRVSFDFAGVPISYKCAAMVSSLSELTNTPFSDSQKSAIVLPRQLEGDFNGLAAQMNKDVYNGLLSGIIKKSWLGIDAIRDYAAQTEDYQPEIQSILSDMEYLEGIGRSPMLKVYTYDYDDETVDRPHVDSSTPNEQTGEKFSDLYVCVFNHKVTRHAPHDDVESSYRWSDGITTYGLKKDAQIATFNNGDIWRQACESNTQVKPFIHWSGTDISDNGAKLILTA